MDVLDISLIFSITLCSLVSGFIFTYSVVVMPGLSKLNDKDFLKAFQVTDAVIQNNQPLFMVFLDRLYFGYLSYNISFISKYWVCRGLVNSFSCFCLFIRCTRHNDSNPYPLNNHIQRIKIEDLNDEVLADQRLKFETKWNFFNTFEQVSPFL
ncbi:MAG: hypothetical protein CM15mP50_5780 [Rhodobacterales bacterium]|nr:MAG: hypothetical protein CM15mP50_5780 [Rhodobacterales bacterium]